MGEREGVREEEEKEREGGKQGEKAVKLYVRHVGSIHFGKDGTNQVAGIVI